MQEAAKTGNKNLLELSINAARHRATLGEISDALESIFTRHKAEEKPITGVYANEVKDYKLFDEAKALVQQFKKLKNSNPKIMICKLGQDGHDRGAKVIASAYSNLGFSVYMSALFLTPEQAVNQAIKNKVHILGISSLAGAHKELVNAIAYHLKKQKRKDIKIVIGGIIPKKDYKILTKMGVVKIFKPGSNVVKTAIDILSILT